MPSTDYASSTDWHRIGPELSVRFSGTPDNIVIEWSPRWPSDAEKALVGPHLRALREQFIKHAAGRIKGALSTPPPPETGAEPWQSLEVAGGMLMLATESGARVATQRDLLQVIALLATLLREQEEEVATWWRQATPPKLSVVRKGGQQ